MTPDDVRATAEQLVAFHEEFAPLFGTDQAQIHASDYLKGLLVCPGRKSVEPIATMVGHGDVSGLQKFLNTGPWSSGDLQDELQAVFARRLAPSASGTAIGTVGVIDGSAFTKQGKHSAGVGWQHNGRLGTQGNCQVGVFLVGVTPAGAALLDHRLYLPEDWCGATPEARARRDQAHIPPEVGFRTKPELAAELVRNVAVLGVVELDWLTADEEFGKNGAFLDELESIGQHYVVEVPRTPRSGTSTRRAGWDATARCRRWPKWPRRGVGSRSGPGPRARSAPSSPRCGSGRCGIGGSARRSGW